MVAEADAAHVRVLFDDARVQGRGWVGHTAECKDDEGSPKKSTPFQPFTSTRYRLKLTFEPKPSRNDALIVWTASGHRCFWGGDSGYSEHRRGDSSYWSKVLTTPTVRPLADTWGISHPSGLRPNRALRPSAPSTRFARCSTTPKILACREDFQA